MTGVLVELETSYKYPGPPSKGPKYSNMQYAIPT